jgi:hypothetical protein
MNLNWEAIGAIGEIVGAAAVVATLAYLAIQTRQSNKIARSNTILELQAENRAHRNSLAQDSELSEIVMKAIGGQELSELELFRYRARSDSSLSYFESIFLQAESGIIEKEDFARFKPMVLEVAKVARRLRIDRSVASPQFAAYVDNLLSKDPTSDA